MAIDPADRVPLGRTGLARDPPRVRRRLDRRPVPAGHRRRRDRDRPPRLGPRRPPVRHRAAVRLRRVRAADRARPWPDRPRDEYVLSTKVGRLVLDAGGDPAGADVDHAGARRPGRRRTTPTRRSGWSSTTPPTAIRRSIEESLERLGLDRIDIALIHDPDDHWEAAIGEALPALARLREEGVIRAVGAGHEPVGDARPVRPRGRLRRRSCSPAATRSSTRTRSTSCCRCASSGASRSSIGGVMNSGDPRRPAAGRPRSTTSRPRPTIVERAQRLAAVCARHGVPLKAAAVQFPLAHPAVVSRRRRRPVGRPPRRVPGAAAPSRSRRDLWAELRDEGLLPADAPTPA